MDSPDLTDSYDWVTAPLPNNALTTQLSDFDSSLRCPICSGLYDIPVTTTCSHTFCSQCIRAALRSSRSLGSTTAFCPVCRVKCDESMLRKDCKVAELVDKFRKLRPKLLLEMGNLSTLVEERDQAPERAPSLEPPPSPSLAPTSSPPPSPRWSVTEKVFATHSGTQVDGATILSFPTSTTALVKWQTRGDTNTIPLTALSKVDDGEGRRSRSSRSSRGINSSKKAATPMATSTKPCNTHAEASVPPPLPQQQQQLQQQQQQQQQQSLHTQTAVLAHTLPHRAKRGYNTLKKKQLKDLCVQDGLDVGGTEDDLRRRHEYFMDLYVAERDKMDRTHKTVKVLAGAVKVWESRRGVERTKEGGRTKEFMSKLFESRGTDDARGPDRVVTTGNADKDMELDAGFKKLIQQAGGGKKRKQGGGEAAAETTTATATTATTATTETTTTTTTTTATTQPVSDNSDSNSDSDVVIVKVPVTKQTPAKKVPPPKRFQSSKSSTHKSVFASSSSSSVPWVCLQCTFNNLKNMTKCEMCMNARKAKKAKNATAAETL